jgi:transportin-3
VNPAVEYCKEIFPVLSAVLDNFIDFSPVVERICRCWRYQLISYRIAMKPLLPQLAQKLVSCFESSRQGCFLWVTSAVVREFSEGAEYVDTETSEAIYQFFERQCLTMLRILNEIPPSELPDVIEDFFRLMVDAVLYYPNRLILSAYFGPVFDASLTALTLQQNDPLIATLHYLRDILSFGGDNPPSSTYGETTPNPPENKQAVKALMLQRGELLTQRILAGLMFNFPKDCVPDGSGVLLGLAELLPNQVASWIQSTIAMLPAGTVSQAESTRVMTGINA